MITIKDVAIRAQVSKSAVSNVFTGNKYTSEALQKKVMQAAEELGYKPNYYAKTLSTKESKVIGLSFNTEEGDPFFEFNKNLITGVLEACEENDYYLLVKLHSKKEEDYFPVDGEICLNPDDQTVPLAGGNRVWIGRPPASLEQTDSYVDNDNGQIGKMVTEHLIKHGYKKIGFLNTTKTKTVSFSRKKGFEEALKQFHREKVSGQHCFLTHKEKQTETAYLQVKKWLTEGLDAFIIDSTYMARGVYQACAELNKKIPEEVGVLAICASTQESSLFAPALTTVELNEYGLGGAAAKLLIEEVIKKKSVPKKVVIDAAIIERESVRGNQINEE